VRPGRYGAVASSVGRRPTPGANVDVRTANRDYSASALGLRDAAARYLKRRKLPV
jgi:hypothetical protein